MQIRKQLRKQAFALTRNPWEIPKCCRDRTCLDGYHGAKPRVRFSSSKSHPGRGTTPRKSKKGGQGK